MSNMSFNRMEFLMNVYYFDENGTVSMIDYY